jgi:hypothetical protein
MRRTLRPPHRHCQFDQLAALCTDLRFSVDVEKRLVERPKKDRPRIENPCRDSQESMFIEKNCRPRILLHSDELANFARHMLRIYNEESKLP